MFIYLELYAQALILHVFFRESRCRAAILSPLQEYKAMPRPHKIRRISAAPEYTLFKPVGVTLKKTDVVELRLDELEAMRLANLEGLYQEQGAQRMHTSRATFGRILEEARRKVTKALIQGKAIHIGGGNVDFCDTSDVSTENTAHLSGITADSVDAASAGDTLPTREAPESTNYDS